MKNKIKDWSCVFVNSLIYGDTGGYEIYILSLTSQFMPVIDTVQCIVHTLYAIHIHYTLYTIHYTLYSIRYTLYTIHYTLYIYIIRYTLYTIQYTI